MWLAKQEPHVLCLHKQRDINVAHPYPSITEVPDTLALFLRKGRRQVSQKGVPYRIKRLLQHVEDGRSCIFTSGKQSNTADIFSMNPFQC